MGLRKNILHSKGMDSEIRPNIDTKKAVCELCSIMTLRQILTLRTWCWVLRHMFQRSWPGLRVQDGPVAEIKYHILHFSRCG